MQALDPLIIALATGLIVAVLVRGVAHKGLDLAMFRANLDDYRLLPDAVVAPAAIALLVAEMSLAAGLLAPALRPAAALGAAALLAAYGAAIAINLARGHVTIDCGCGGPGSGLSWLLVARNAALVAIALVAAMPAADRVLGLADFTVLVAGVATAFVVLVGLEQAAGNNAHVWHARHQNR